MRGVLVSSAKLGSGPHYANQGFKINYNNPNNFNDVYRDIHEN